MKTFLKNLAKVLMFVSSIYIIATALGMNWDEMNSNGVLIMWIVLCISASLYAGVAD